MTGCQSNKLSVAKRLHVVLVQVRIVVRVVVVGRVGGVDPLGVGVGTVTGVGAEVGEGWVHLNR